MTCVNASDEWRLRQMRVALAPLMTYVSGDCAACGWRLRRINPGTPPGAPRNSLNYFEHVQYLNSKLSDMLVRNSQDVYSLILNMNNQKSNKDYMHFQILKPLIRNSEYE